MFRSLPRLKRKIRSFCEDSKDLFRIRLLLLFLVHLVQEKQHFSTFCQEGSCQTISQSRVECASIDNLLNQLSLIVKTSDMWCNKMPFYQHWHQDSASDLLAILDWQWAKLKSKELFRILFWNWDLLLVLRQGLEMQLSKESVEERGKELLLECSWSQTQASSFWMSQLLD